MELKKAWEEFTNVKFFEYMRELIKNSEPHKPYFSSIIEIDFDDLLRHLQEEIDEVEEILTKRGFDLVFDYKPILKELGDLACMCAFTYTKIKLEQQKFLKEKNKRCI